MICPHCKRNIAVPRSKRPKKEAVASRLMTQIRDLLKSPESKFHWEIFTARDFWPFLEGQESKRELNAKICYLLMTGELIRVARGLYKRGSLL